MATSKKRVIKSYEKLSEELLAQLQALYPLGYSQHIIYYTNPEGKLVPAIPLETEDTYYMVKMPVQAIVVDEEAEVEPVEETENSAETSPETSHSLEELEELAYGGSYTPIGGDDMEAAMEQGEEPDY